MITPDIAHFSQAVRCARVVIECREKAKLCKTAHYKASTKALQARARDHEAHIRYLADQALKSP